MQHVTVPRFTSIDIRLVDGAAIRIGIEDELFRSLIDKPKDYQRLLNTKCDSGDETDSINCDFELPQSIICNTINVSGGGVLMENVPDQAEEDELVDLFDELESDDFAYSRSKPLKIDPNVLKLDFSNLTGRTLSDNNYKPFEQFSSKTDNRASHHLSGGGLVTDSSRESVFQNYDFTGATCGNPVSPSSPLTFDLSARHGEVKNVTSRISTDSECTNPFKNFMRDVLEEESCFSATNPFNEANISSPGDVPSINCQISRFEDVSPPRKSFSQCSTRPASPTIKIEDSTVLNPFLLNRTSPEPRTGVPVQLPHLFINDRNFQAQVTPTTQAQSPFIFAVPVLPIFPHSITNSSTQTQSEEPTTEHREKPPEPVYQNITNQLRKYMEKNDHSEYDLQCLKTTLNDLRTSGWYYENVSWQESVVLLRNTEPGTFLIRDSSDPNFLFSLSVQTSRGPTSVRLHYVNGQFRLDAEEKLIPHMPSFNSVVELIDYYIENTMKNKMANQCKKSLKRNGKLQKSKEQVWIDSQGNIYSNILLVKPLRKKEHFTTLQHLARLTINRHIKKQINTKVKVNFRVTPVYESSPFQNCSFPNNSFDNFCPILSLDTLPLPTTLIDYLKDYPYCH